MTTSSAARGSADLRCGSDCRRGRSGVGRVGRGLRAAGAPEADESGDERDEEELADEHLEDREGLADRSGGDEVAVAGCGEGGVAEEEVVAGAARGETPVKKSVWVQWLKKTYRNANSRPSRVKTLIAPRIVRKSTWLALRTTRRRIVTAAMPSRIATTPNARPSRRSDGMLLGEERRDDGGARCHAGQAHPGGAHVGAGQGDDRGQPGDRDGGDAPAPALGGQRHHHDERGRDQEQDEAVGVADPFGQLERRLTPAAHTTSRRPRSARSSGIHGVSGAQAPLLLAARQSPACLR